MSSDPRSKYTATIGIECHVQFKTETKLFSGAGNDSRSAQPNTLINHIDFGLPGALPVINQKAIDLAVRAAYALNVPPQHFSKFDRKHYFYPDLPMGYQITQYDQPIIQGGFVEINVDGKYKKIGITRAHLEADAGKSVHPDGSDYSLVDLNRAGTPLLEIVSQPDMTNAQEAKAFGRELYLIMRYADVSDANLFYGNMRFDVNVSVSKTKTLGTRSETKNINSFRAIEKTIEYEIKRQVDLLEKGQSIAQETRGWDDVKQKTFLQRTKENAEDYRYMPDPDLPPVILEPDYLKEIKSSMPLMPKSWRDKLTKIGLNSDQIESMLDAEVEIQEISYLPILENQSSSKDIVKFLSNWFVNLEIPLRKDEKIKNNLKDVQREEAYIAVYKLQKNGKLSSTNIKALLSNLLNLDVIPKNIEKYAEAENFIQVSDKLVLDKIVTAVIKDNSKAAADVKAGEAKAIGYLVGQVMKLSQGKANPSLAGQLIKEKLDFK